MAEFEIRRRKDGAVAGIDAPFATLALDMLGWKPEECEVILKKQTPYSSFKLLYFRTGTAYPVPDPDRIFTAGKS
jgi:hypothetical protein